MAAQRRPLSTTGVAEFDVLAKDSPEALQAFLDEVRKDGWIVKATEKLSITTVAEFFARKGRFYYDPERMTILDMLHEAKHLELFRQRGNWKSGRGQGARDELEAYKFEFELGRQNGFSLGYMQYLEGGSRNSNGSSPQIVSEGRGHRPCPTRSLNGWTPSHDVEIPARCVPSLRC